MDRDLTEEERAQIQALIDEELKTQDINVIHPQVDALYPMPHQPALIKHISPEDVENNEEFTLGGVDIQRYSNLEDSEALQQSLAYTYLRQSSLRVHAHIGNNQWLAENELQEFTNRMLEDEVGRKRQVVNGVNSERKRLQGEVQPVVEYLEARWVQSVQKNVQLGVSILQEKHGLV